MERDRDPSTKVLIALAAILVVVGIGLSVFALNRNDKSPAADTKSSESTNSTNSPTTTAPTTTDGEAESSETPTIVFTDDGFSQSTYTFPAGKAIKVDNQSSMDMQFSSDDHPTHRNHTEMNMAVLGAGESGTFTPAGKGTYGFHDHINDQFEGTLVIQ